MAFSTACCCMRWASCGLTARRADRDWPHVVQPDYVPAELRLHRFLGVLALLQCGHGFGKRLHVGVGRAHSRGRRHCSWRILGFLGEFLELRALFDLRDDVLGLGFLSTRMRALYSLSPICVLIFSYSALRASSLTGVFFR